MLQSLSDINCNCFWYFIILSGGAEEQWEKDLEAELNDYEILGVDAVGRKRATAQATASGASQKPLASSISSGGRSGTDEEATLTDGGTALGSSGGGGIRTRTTNNDWEEYADLIEDTDDLK